MARLAKAAKAASWVSVGLAGLFVLFHETPLLAVVGLAVGFLGLLVQSAGGETRTTVPVLGLFLNGFGVVGMYAQRYAVKYVASLRGGQFLTAQDLKSVPMAAFLGPFVVGGLVILLTKSNLPSAQTPDSVMPAAKVEPLDVVLGLAKGRRVVLKHEDRYLHTLVVGTTGTGKTSRVLKPMIWQDLQAIKAGTKLGVTVIEPKGDFAADVAKMCEDLEIPHLFVNPEDPGSPRFNPLEGDAVTVAEITRTVFQALFGKQEAFFALNQAIAARNIVLLLKAVKGDDVDLADMANALRDYTYMRTLVAELEKKDGRSPLVDYFKAEVLGMEEKAKQFQLGLRLQLDNIINNRMLNNVLCGKSDLDLDDHLANGGVLIANTCLGTLGGLGDAFGQFLIMHFQQAVFRRPLPPEMPQMLYIDEFPRYVNPDFERLLAIGRSFRCATCLVVQATAQIQLEEKRAFKETVLETCRNKVVLNIGSADDAKRFAAEFGEREALTRMKTYNRTGLLVPWAWDSIREQQDTEERYPYTKLMELQKFRAAVRIVRDGQPLEPVMADLDLSPWDKRRARGQGRRRVRTPELVGFPDAKKQGVNIVMKPVKAKKDEDFFR